MPHPSLQYFTFPHHIHPSSQYFTSPHHTAPFLAIFHFSSPHFTLPRNNSPRITTLHFTLRRNTSPLLTTLQTSLQYFTFPHHTLSHFDSQTLLPLTIQYITLEFNWMAKIGSLLKTFAADTLKLFRPNSVFILAIFTANLSFLVY